MTERNKQFLRQEFKNGARPSAEDFEDLFDSFLNKRDDLSLDDDGNMSFTGSVQLGDSNSTELGTLRFHNNQVQYYNGTWVDIASGAGGAFQPIEGSTAVSYASGNVGIGSFATSPTYRLEVELGDNTGEAERVRFGRVVCSNGTSPDHGFACFSHENYANNISYALRQSPTGEVHINAPYNPNLAGRFNSISMRQTDPQGAHTRIYISSNGNVIIGTELEAFPDRRLQIDGSMFVGGPAYKSDNAETWDTTSDVRVKEDVQDLEMGLEQLMQVRPVRFRYNGKAGTNKGQEGVGIIGQEIEQIFPEMVKRVSNSMEPDIEDLLVYNGSNLKYVLVNAVKQLAERVQELETALIQSKNKGNDMVE